MFDRLPLLLAAPLLLGACGDGSECRFGAPGEPLSTVTRWSWQDGEVFTTPLVTDLDDDGVADVVINHARLDGKSLEIGELVALDGATGHELWRIHNEPTKDRHGTAGRATAAIGDVDADGRPDIVYAGREDGERRSAIHAVDADGRPLWTSHDGQALATTRVASGALVLADLDDDPNLEVIVGGVILDHDGALAWADHRGGVLGSPFKEPNIYDLLYPGGLATVADLDADGTLELITGREAWKIQLYGGSLVHAQVQQLWFTTSGEGNDGYPAVADLDGNGTPEVVLVSWPELLIVDGATGDLWCGVDASGKRCEADPALRTRPILNNDSGLGGPPTLADFDGDGRLEIGVAGSSRYNLYDLFRDGEDVATHVGDPPAPGDIYLRWSAKISDPSTGSNGALAFDFHGDGAAEVIHQDECFARVLDGRTGAVLAELRSSSVTVHEYPVVADLDGDRHAELIVAASHRDAINNCDGVDEQRQGIFVHASDTGPWAPARPEWTAHATHLGNSFREARAADDDRCGP